MWNGLKHLGFYVGFGQYLCDLGHFSLELFSSSVEWGGWKTGLLGPLPTSVLHYSISLKLPSSFVLFFFILRGSQESNSTFVIMTVIWKMMIISPIFLDSEICHDNGWKSTSETAVYYKSEHCWLFECGKYNRGQPRPFPTVLYWNWGLWVWGNKQKGHLV